MKHEADLAAKGAGLVGGVDEVGVGAWAGPVVVGVVVLAPGKRIYKVRDSKLLDSAHRECLAIKVREQCLCWSVGASWPHEIDGLGLSEAIRRAGRRALAGLATRPDALLVDGNWNFFKPQPSTLFEPAGRYSSYRTEEIDSSDALMPGWEQRDPAVRMVVRGDCESVSIACASLVAKTVRDRLMADISPVFPSYSFQLNKGYPSPLHKWALAAYGPSPLHRRLFAPVRKLVDEGTPGRLLPPANHR